MKYLLWDRSPADAQGGAGEGGGGFDKCLLRTQRYKGSRMQLMSSQKNATSSPFMQLV